MNWLNQFKNMNTKQKDALKLKFNAIYTHPIFHLAAFFIGTYALLFAYGKIG